MWTQAVCEWPTQAAVANQLITMKMKRKSLLQRLLSATVQKELTMLRLRGRGALRVHALAHHPESHHSGACRTAFHSLTSSCFLCVRVLTPPPTHTHTCRSAAAAAAARARWGLLASQSNTSGVLADTVDIAVQAKQLGLIGGYAGIDDSSDHDDHDDDRRDHDDHTDRDHRGDIADGDIDVEARATRRERPFALAGPQQLLALYDQPQVLALEDQPQVLALEDQPQVLALEGQPAQGKCAAEQASGVPELGVTLRHYTPKISVTTVADLGAAMALEDGKQYDDGDRDGDDRDDRDDHDDRDHDADSHNRDHQLAIADSDHRGGSQLAMTLQRSTSSDSNDDHTVDDTRSSSGDPYGGHGDGSDAHNDSGSSDGSGDVPRLNETFDLTVALAS
jgi:hypothetical protein